MTLYSSYFKFRLRKHLPADPEDPLGTARFFSVLDVICKLAESSSMDSESKKLLEADLLLLIKVLAKATTTREDIDDAMDSLNTELDLYED